MISLDETQSPESRYRAWVNNKVAALYLTIERRNRQDERGFLRHEFFLDELEHHFMDNCAGRRVWRAFDFLKRYLKSDPDTKMSHRTGALRMLGLIYQRLGFDGRKIYAAV